MSMACRRNFFVGKPLGPNHGMVDIRNIIIRLTQDHRKTILLSSHILPEVELIATRMVIINKGKAIVEGNVRELLKDRGLEEYFISITQGER